MKTKKTTQRINGKAFMIYSGDKGRFPDIKFGKMPPHENTRQEQKSPKSI